MTMTITTPADKCLRIYGVSPMALCLEAARSAVADMKDDLGGGRFGTVTECLDSHLGNLMDTLDELGIVVVYSTEMTAAEALVSELTDADESIRSTGGDYGPSSDGAIERAARAL